MEKMKCWQMPPNCSMGKIGVQDNRSDWRKKPWEIIVRKRDKQPQEEEFGPKKEGGKTGEKIGW
jgi:hypothetical protein